MSQRGLLNLAHEKLYWPTPREIFKPFGAGPSIYAKLAKEKLGKNIERDCHDGIGIKIGILAINPRNDETVAPIAVVCDFPKRISERTLKKTYNLAWSFSRTRALITLEPHLLRVWTCCEEPPLESETLNPISIVSRNELDSTSKPSLSQRAAESLHWVDLASGHFFQKHDERFQRSKSADYMLLNNLKSVRRQLNEELNLDSDTIHDLLARIIFVQFLFQRKDSFGNPALNRNILKKLHMKGILSEDYSDLTEILSNHKDTYSFFHWLNNKFNGDLFPGAGNTVREREVEWHKEERKVEEKHLSLLAEFISGKLKMDNGQRCLWPHYSFDAIPLDFISSIYEEFVRYNGTEAGVHYTPGHIVDFMLDSVLPWNDQNWDFKILDPACGSGIFLVKAFQRLIHRWKKAHPDEEINSRTLRYLLEHNLFGVDKNSHAVRVASFSLYLTMCDEIDPKHYWRQVLFPRLRNRQLIAADFFREDIEGIRTEKDATKYDLVIGNAPWRRNTATEAARSWAINNNWTLTYGNIGPLFLPKAAALAKPRGRVAMLQPAGTLIFNQISTAKEFRKKIFSEFKIEEIVNLSALRFGLFKDAISPSCIVTMCVITPDSESISYICPKPMRTNEDDYRLVVEPQDINSITSQEATNDPLIWTALMWGGNRDLSLIRRLNQQINLEKLEAQGIAKIRQGIIRGKERHEEIIGRRILSSKHFPEGSFFHLKAERLPRNNDPGTHRLTDLEAFEMPQMIIKQGWQKKNKRFQSVITISDGTTKGIICSKSYISVHVSDEYQSLIDAACLGYNSKLAVYFLLLSSGRFASYRPEPNLEDILRVPIPEYQSKLLKNVNAFEDIDEYIRLTFAFKDSEWVLIDDLFQYTLPDFKGDSCSPGRQKTKRLINDQIHDNNEPELRSYCEYFIRVIKAGFVQKIHICAGIFQEKTRFYLPVRLIAIYFNPPFQKNIKLEKIDYQALLERLEKLNNLFMDDAKKKYGDIFYQRVARVYTTTNFNGEKVPTIYIVKPDKVRYWTRSMALRDADEVAADIMLWNLDTSKEQLVEDKIW